MVFAEIRSHTAFCNIQFNSLAFHFIHSVCKIPSSLVIQLEEYRKIEHFLLIIAGVLFVHFDELSRNSTQPPIHIQHSTLHITSNTNQIQHKNVIHNPTTPIVPIPIPFTTPRPRHPSRKRQNHHNKYKYNNPPPPLPHRPPNHPSRSKAQIPYKRRTSKTRIREPCERG